MNPLNAPGAEGALVSAPVELQLSAPADCYSTPPVPQPVRTLAAPPPLVLPQSVGENWPHDFVALPGALRFRSSLAPNGWTYANPGDAMYSTVSMRAQEVWKPQDGWVLIHPELEEDLTMGEDAPHLQQAAVAEELAEAIGETLGRFADRISLAAVLGVLTIVQKGLIDDYS